MNISGVKDKNGTPYGLDPAQHTHSESEGWLSTIVNMLQTAINGKAAAMHNHTNDSWLTTLLAGKADTNHTQAISTITGLQTALDGKANVGEVVTHAGLVASLEPYQLKEDEALETTDKTIVGAINEVNTRTGGVIEIGDGESIDLAGTVAFGALYHIDNHDSQASLESLIINPGIGAIHFHQSAATMVAEHFMVRIYNYEPDYFVEVAGAWGIIQ